jgi:hypothetical protein
MGPGTDNSTYAVGANSCRAYKSNDRWRLNAPCHINVTGLSLLSDEGEKAKVTNPNGARVAIELREKRLKLIVHTHERFDTRFERELPEGNS